MTLFQKIRATLTMLRKTGTTYGNAYSVCFFLFNNIEVRLKSGMSALEASLSSVSVLKTISEDQISVIIENSTDDSKNRVYLWDLLYNSAWTQHANLNLSRRHSDDIRSVSNACSDFMARFWKKSSLVNYFDKSSQL